MVAPHLHHEKQVGRVAEVTRLLAEVFADRAEQAARATAAEVGRPWFVVVDGRPPHAAAFADLLAARLSATGPTRRLPDDVAAAPDADSLSTDHLSPVPPGPAVVVADGPRRRAIPPSVGWDAVVYLRTAPSPQGSGRSRDADHSGEGDGDGEQGASVVVDYHDPTWPVIRRLHPDLADRERWYLPESRAFFAARAATWDTRFGDDMPAYADAVAEAGLEPAYRVADLGCGTGRALPAMRAAVGRHGTVLGIDVTPEMLEAARHAGREQHAALLIADARRLPILDAGLDAVFAAGLVNHLPDAKEGLTELARVTRPGGRLVIFHPSGRAALAARHGRTLRPGEPLDRSRLEPLFDATGWRLIRYDDAAHRFLAVAQRTG